MIQEIFGINSFIRQGVELLTRSGYLAIAPDLFWRRAAGIQLNDQDPVDRATAFELYATYDENQGIADLMATMAFLKQRPGCTGQVGSVGFCLGGKLAYLMATRSPAQCNVSFYGVGIETCLAERTQIQTPLLLHLAGADEFVPLAAQTEIQTELQENPLVIMYGYPGVGHGFARSGGSNYNRVAATLAWERTLGFFRQHLK